VAGKRRVAERTDEEKAAAEASRKAKLADLQQQITDAVGDLTNSDQWKSWLSFATKFRDYSFGNTLAIMMQRPDASWVAGFKRWKDLGRNVRKGEKGIAILAPLVGRRASASPEEAAATPEHGGSEEPEQQRGIYGFRVAYVFDISQTDGPALDIPEHPGNAPATPRLLEGEAPRGLWSALEQIATDNGYQVERGSCDGTRNGWTNYARRLIRVRDDVDDAQASKTLAHEIAHMLMHEPSAFDFGITTNCRGSREVEAESVAYITAAHHGLDTASYTFAYVATWAQRAANLERGQSPEDIVRACGHRILQTASIVTGRTDELLGRATNFDFANLGDRVTTGQQRTRRLREQAEPAEALPPGGRVAQAQKPLKDAFPALRPTPQPAGIPGATPASTAAGPRHARTGTERAARA
jgi:antirestriction protein ArdC